MCTWHQLSFREEVAEINSYSVSTDSQSDALEALPIRVRNKLAQAGITSLAQLASLSKDEILRIKQLGPQAVSEIEALRVQYEGSETENFPTVNYAEFWPQLIQAHGVSIRQYSTLSPRALNALHAVGIDTAALLLLVFLPDLQESRAIGTTTIQQLQRVQQAAAEQFNLMSIVGRVRVVALTRVASLLNSKQQSHNVASDTTETKKSLATIEREVVQQRLNEYWAVKFISGDEQSDLTFVDLQILVDNNELNDQQRLLQYVSRIKILAEALDAKTIDAEIDAMYQRFDERSRTILRSRYDPIAPMTLEELGVRYSLTRERIRQLQAKATKQLTALAQQRCLARLRSAICDAAELTERGQRLEDIEESLRTRRLLVNDEAFSDLLTIWHALNLERPFIHEQMAAANEGLSAAQLSLRKQLHRTIDRLCRNCGAVALRWLPAGIEDEDARAVLFSLNYEEIAPGWYWRDIASKDVVESVARKTFAVTARITVREFRLSLTKHLARREFPAPPTAVLREVVLRLGFVTEQDGELVSAKVFVPTDELNGSEMALYRYIKINGPVVTFQELFEVMRDEGYKTITLAVRLKQSPIIRKVKLGLYTLVGSEYTQDDIARAEGRIKEINGQGELRYNTDGTVTYLVNAGSWLLYGGVISAPELSQFGGTWVTEEGTKVGINKTNVWGLQGAASKLGIQLGERIALHLNTWDQTIAIVRVEPS